MLWAMVIFQLTTSRRGRRSVIRPRDLRFAFQLTTSRRGRQTHTRLIVIFRYFNSRPHEEVDGHLISLFHNLVLISTHDLTKRSTSVALYTNVLFPFQLTTSRRGRRQKCRRVHSKIQKFQLTTSRRGRPGTSPSSANSLLFQLTTSRRGRPTACYRSWYSSYISTHDLTKRSTLAVLPHAQMR